MKILFLHPYGELGDWNTRIRRQIELMKEKCEVFVVSEIPTEIGLQSGQVDNMLKEIKKVSPDILYVNGFLMEAVVRQSGLPFVYDMGSFKTKNILIQKTGKNIKELLAIETGHLISQAAYTRMGDYYRVEKSVLEKAKAIIAWEGDEIELMGKLFGKKITDKVKPISMMFSDLPKPIPFEQKEKKIIAIAPKWGDREKNFGLLSKVKIPIEVIGHGVDIKYLPHSELMAKLNNLRVLFCPYKSGGCGVVSEGLRLGCNVVTMDYFPFNSYVNDELIIKDRNIDAVLEKALDKYFSLKKELPTEEEQISKIIDLCSNSI